MRNIPPGPWGSFVAKADTFMVKTKEHALQGVNPGGYYIATWCRDASYILRDWTLSGNMTAALQQLYQIWSHQIQPGRGELVYGRGSPEMKFLSEEAEEDKKKNLREHCLRQYTKRDSLNYMDKIPTLIPHH